MKKGFFLKATVFLILLFSFLSNLESSAKEYSLNTRSVYDFSTIHYKSGSNDYDHDFYQYINFSSDGYGLENLTTYFSMRYEKDLDGTNQKNYFKDITDTYDSNDQFKIYNAYVKLNDFMKTLDLTLGRQYFYGAEIAHFDGGRVDVKKIGPVELSLFGGRRVTFYEHPERFGMWGANLSLYPLEGTKVAARVVKYIDYSYDFSIYQNITPEIDFSGTYSLINNDPRDLKLNLNYRSYNLGTQAVISYYRKLSSSSADDFYFDYTSSDKSGGRYLVENLNIGKLAPYQDYYLLLHQRLYKGLGVGISYTRRDLINSNEQDQYNNSFDEFTVGFDWSDFIFDGTDVLVNWKYFKNDRHTQHFENKSNVFEGQVAQKLSDKLFVSAGGFYKFYDYNNRKLDTFGFNGDIKAYLTKNIDFKIKYAYEKDDPAVLPFSQIDYIQNVTVEVGFKF